MMVDVSATGARLVLETSDLLPDRLFLLLSHNGNLRRLCSVVWQTGATAASNLCSVEVTTCDPPPQPAKRYKDLYQAGGRSEIL